MKREMLQQKNGNILSIKNEYTSKSNLPIQMVSPLKLKGSFHRTRKHPKIDMKM